MPRDSFMLASEPETPHQAAQAAAHSVKESGGLPQLNPESYASQIFWLALTFALLYLLISKSALPPIQSILERRRMRIAEDLDRADVMTQQAESARAAYEKIEADGRKAATSLIAEAQHAAQHEASEAFASLDASLAEQLEKAKASLDQQKAGIDREIGPMADAVAGQIVAKLLGREAKAPAISSARKAAS